MYNIETRIPAVLGQKSTYKLIHSNIAFALLGNLAEILVLQNSITGLSDSVPCNV